MEDTKNDLDVILSEITSALTGESEHDAAYLMEQIEKYRSHDMSKEIIRACGRLLYDLIPDEARDKIAQVTENERLGVDAVLEEVRYNMYKGNFDKALTMIEGLIRRREKLNRCQDDTVSEYHSFKEPFEEILYKYRYRPEKDIRQANVDYSGIYLLYGTVLTELKEYEKAKNALQTALRWNPVCAAAYFELAEVFKITQNPEEFFRLTTEAFRIAFHSSDVARCYRNFGYYFVGKELYPAAAGCYYMSGLYEPDSKQAMSELFYISTKAGNEVLDQAGEDINKYSEQYGIPRMPDNDIIGLSYAHGRQCYEQAKYELAGYFWDITYDLTRDEEIGEKLDEIREMIR